MRIKKTLLKIFVSLLPSIFALSMFVLPAYAGGIVNEDGQISCPLIVDAFQNVINLVFAAAGIAFFVMMVVGGGMYMISAGNPDGVQRAQQTLIWGVAGTLVSVGMFFLTSTIAGDVLGDESTASDIFNLQKWICDGF